MIEKQLRGAVLDDYQDAARTAADWSPLAGRVEVVSVADHFTGEDDLVAAAVSIHLVLGQHTRGLLGAAELTLMKPTGYLINTSRAAIIDQDAQVGARAEPTTPVIVHTKEMPCPTPSS